jgi:RNA polymerase sigma factor (sigma-70 family)
MASTTLSQVWKFVPMATGYVSNSFGLGGQAAADVVHDVLLRLLRRGPERLDYPKAYFFRACRWRALQVLRGGRRRDRAYRELWRRRGKVRCRSEVLAALEERDEPEFIDRATPKQREVLELLVEGRSRAEVSEILGVPESTVRMRIHLARKRLGRNAA